MRIGIVGGGITGLYCALKLSKKHHVVLFDDRGYLGGRIKTQDHMELGAARFNKTHRLLFALIRRYALTPVRLPLNYDYLAGNTIYKNANQLFDAGIHQVIEHTTLNKKLRDLTFYEHCVNLLGRSNADVLVSIFGYYTEMKEMNAYDAIQSFQSDFVATQYYVLAEGLSVLCQHMAAEILQRGSLIYTNERVIDATASTLTTAKRRVEIDRVIFCTKARQLNQFSLLNSIHPCLKAVHEAPLLRIYARYKTVWFHDVNRMTTDNVLRQIIPIDKEKGILLVSYTDGKDTEPFLPLLKKPKELSAMIHTNLTQLFPDRRIPKPTFLLPYYWEVGTHVWKPGVNSSQIYKKVLNPVKHVYVCGEAYSMRQEWMEGGLLMAKDVIDQIG